MNKTSMTDAEILRLKSSVTKSAVVACVGALVFMAVHMKSPAGSVIHVAAEFLSIMFCMAGMYMAGILYCVRKTLGFRLPGIGIR